MDGPYSNITVNIGPGFTSQPRCVNRRITDAMSGSCSKAAVQKALAPDNYEAAWRAIYSGPHLMGHIALSMMVRLTHGKSLTPC